jgi:hypothetical protein
LTNSYFSECKKQKDDEGKSSSPIKHENLVQLDLHPSRHDRFAAYPTYAATEPILVEDVAPVAFGCATSLTLGPRVGVEMLHHVRLTRVMKQFLFNITQVSREVFQGFVIGSYSSSSVQCADGDLNGRGNWGLLRRDREDLRRSEIQKVGKSDDCHRNKRAIF